MIYLAERYIPLGREFAPHSPFIIDNVIGEKRALVVRPYFVI